MQAHICMVCFVIHMRGVIQDMSMDPGEWYDRIYRYCYFKLHDRELAEDITQGTFLRYLERYHCDSLQEALCCLYTIAGHLCVEAYRKRITPSSFLHMRKLPADRPAVVWTAGFPAKGVPHTSRQSPARAVRWWSRCTPDPRSVWCRQSR